MSHYSKQECAGVEDEELLAKALEDIGCKVEIGENLTIKSPWQNKREVKIKLPANSGVGNRYEAGFVKNSKGELGLVKESMDSALNKDFINRVKQHYQKRKAMKLARQKGLTLQAQRTVGRKIQLVYNV
jgi:hypothetical protein